MLQQPSSCLNSSKEACHSFAIRESETQWQKTQGSKSKQQKVVSLTAVQQLQNQVIRQTAKNKAKYEQLQSLNPTFIEKLYQPECKINLKKLGLQTSQELLFRQLDKLLTQEEVLQQKLRHQTFHSQKQSLERQRLMENVLAFDKTENMAKRGWKMEIAQKGLSETVQEKIQRLNCSIAGIRRTIAEKLQEQKASQTLSSPEIEEWVKQSAAYHSIAVQNAQLKGEIKTLKEQILMKRKETQQILDIKGLQIQLQEENQKLKEKLKKLKSLAEQPFTKTQISYSQNLSPHLFVIKSQVLRQNNFSQNQKENVQSYTAPKEQPVYKQPQINQLKQKLNCGGQLAFRSQKTVSQVLQFLTETTTRPKTTFDSSKRSTQQSSQSAKIVNGLLRGFSCRKDQKCKIKDMGGQNPLHQLKKMVGFDNKFIKLSVLSTQKGP